MGYINFDITVSKGVGGGYVIKCNYEAGSEASAGRPGLPDLSSNEFDQFQTYLRGESNELLVDIPQLVGAQLHQWLFPRLIFASFNTCLTDAIRQENKVRLRLHFEDPSLRSLPWEYMYDSDWFHDFLALFRKNPIVRYIESPIIPQSLKRKRLDRNKAARLLLAFSVNPADKAAVETAEAELKAILEELSLQIRQKRVVVEEAGQVHLEKLQERLVDFEPDMLHLVAASQGGQKPSLILFDEKGQPISQSANQFKTLLRDTARVVVLSAPPNQAGGNEAGLELAEALMWAEVPAVVALHREMPAEVAGRFAAQFYRYLARANSLDDALTEMRINIHGYDEVAWGIPAMYMRVKDGRIWDEFDPGEPPVDSPAGLPPGQQPVQPQPDPFLPFMQLNFNNQVHCFSAVLDRQRIGGCLVHNQPQISSSRNAIQLLMKRLVKMVPAAGELPQEYHHNLASPLFKNGPEDVWKRLARKLNLEDLNPPFTRRKQEKIADRLGELLKRRHVFFFFHNVDEVIVKDLLADFWEPLVSIILDPEVPLLPEGGFLCLAFFVDDDGRIYSKLGEKFVALKIGEGRVPEPDGGWQKVLDGASFALPPVNDFSEGELALLEHFYDPDIVNEVKSEMDSSGNRQPDFVIDFLVDLLELNERGEFSNWLQSWS
jgi:hypothetical protein